LGTNFDFPVNAEVWPDSTAGPVRGDSHFQMPAGLARASATGQR